MGGQVGEDCMARGEGMSERSGHGREERAWATRGGMSAEGWHERQRVARSGGDAWSARPTCESHVRSAPRSTIPICISKIVEAPPSSLFE